ncbi:MAG: aldehyde dehydrogenase family protein, partial [Planococcus donghaensis]
MKTDYSKIYIDGEWTTGSSDSQMKNTNPFTGEELVTTQAADKSDLDKAYKAAAKAQVTWSKELPQKKQEVLEKALEVMQENKELIIDWLVKEAGSTVFKATAEFGVSVNILKEA